MTVLWITDFFPATSKGEITGGVEARCFFVKKYLPSKTIKIKIISRSTTGKIWHTASIRSFPERLKFTLTAVIAGLKTDFDVVEGTNFATYLIALLLGILKRKPVVYWYPDVFFGRWFKLVGLAGLLGEISDWIILHFPKGTFVAISHSTKERLMAAGISPDMIKVIYCGYDKKEIDLVSNVGGKVYDICAVSRLLTYKRLGDLIRAIKLIMSDFPKIKVVIIGQGPEKNNLENLIKKFHLEKNINLLGHLSSHKDVLTVVKKSKIFCHPSIVEGFGIVVMEALALGIPGVVAKIPTSIEITANGQGVIFFKPKDAKDLAKNLKVLLKNKTLYRQKVQETKKVVGQFQWEKLAYETAEFYKTLI